MKWYIKNNGMARVILYGYHPMKDFVVIGSGIEHDVRYIPFIYFFENYTEEK